MSNHQSEGGAATSDRPEEFRYETGVGLVVKSYPTWEVDILAAAGGLLQRVVVTGPRLPEASTPERPQWVVYGFAGHTPGNAWCVPIPSQLGGPRFSRRDLVYCDEVANFRRTIDRAGVLEIRNSKGDVLLQQRIIEQGGVIDSRTPDTHIEQRQDTKGIEVFAGEGVRIACKNATIHAEENVDVQAGGNVTVQADGAASIAATTATVHATGVLTLKGAQIALNPLP